ncbi:MAG TPA: hypothetical protein VF570_13195 [Pyrinomonadaceae bacterium]|jgi:hypothetical protein
MTSFPGSPRLFKGAIIGLDPFNPLASVVVFQYNPETLTRNLVAQTTGGDADRGEALRLKGPPTETITVKIDVDATDQLEQAQVLATTMGIYPVLASLEMLIYPKSIPTIANEALAAVGVIEVVPPEAPLTLFVWGVKRVLPVRITSFAITEEAFDPNLNPIRASVSLGLQVLTYHDLGLLSAGGALFMAHQIIKEVMATINGVGTVASAASGALSGSAGVSIG